jgi:hypothetical protein
MTSLRKGQPTHRQRVEETGNRLLEMVEPVVEIRVVAPFFHQTASMSDGGAIALEKVTDLGEAHPAADVGEIHRDLSGKRGSRRAADPRYQSRTRGSDCRLDRPPDPRGPNPESSPLNLIRIAFTHGSHHIQRRFSNRIKYLSTL